MAQTGFSIGIKTYTKAYAVEDKKYNVDVEFFWENVDVELVRRKHKLESMTLLCLF